MCLPSRALSHNSLIVYLESSRFNVSQSVSVTSAARSTRVTMSFKNLSFDFNRNSFYYILKDKHYIFLFIHFFSRNISIIVFLELVFFFPLCATFQIERSNVITLFYLDHD